MKKLFSIFMAVVFGSSIFAADFAADKAMLEVQLHGAISSGRYDAAEKISATLTNLEAREVLQKQNRTLEKINVLCKLAPIALNHFTEKPEVQQEMKEDIEFAIGMQIFKITADFLANDSPDVYQEAQKVNLLIDTIMDQQKK